MHSTVKVGYNLLCFEARVYAIDTNERVNHLNVNNTFRTFVIKVHEIFLIESNHAKRIRKRYNKMHIRYQQN